MKKQHKYFFSKEARNEQENLIDAKDLQVTVIKRLETKMQS